MCDIFLCVCYCSRPFSVLKLFLPPAECSYTGQGIKGEREGEAKKRDDREKIDRVQDD